MKTKTPEELLEAMRDAKSSASSACSRLEDDAEDVVHCLRTMIAERDLLRAALARALDCLDPIHPVYLELRRLAWGEKP